MLNIELVSGVIGVTVGIGGTVIALLPTLKKKGVNTENVLEKIDTVLTGVDSLINVADKIIPNNPANNRFLLC